MNRPWIRKALLVSVLAGTGLAISCGTNPDGKYQAAGGAVTMELNSGKASMNFGGIQMDGTYKVDGDKITISPTVGDTSQTMVFTINKDGSLSPPPGSPLPPLQKAK